MHSYMVREISKDVNSLCNYHLHTSLMTLTYWVGLYNHCFYFFYQQKHRDTHTFPSSSNSGNHQSLRQWHAMALLGLLYWSHHRSGITTSNRLKSWLLPSQPHKRDAARISWGFGASMGYPFFRQHRQLHSIVVLNLTFLTWGKI